jgi:hypothetical protein
MEGGYPAYSTATPVIYASFLINVILGRMLLRNSTSPARIAAVALAGSVQFFFITNFYSWLGAGSMYGHNMSGLLTCYAAALPFFARTVLGDLFYTGVLFAAYAVLSRRFSRSEHTPAAV